jgi:hypothetical protein
LGTASWEPKLELLHSCVPKLELGNKKQKICTLSRASVKHIIINGEMIENYPDDKPFPSGLFYGPWEGMILDAIIS